MKHKKEGNIKPNFGITNYLTMKILCEAKYFFEAKTRDDFIMAVNVANKLRVPIIVIGGGSNIATFNDNINALVVKNSYIFKEIVKKNKEIMIKVSSGYPVSRLVNETVEMGWSGFEYHAGLPGTVGGALYTNAKWTKPLSYFSDNLVSATLIDNNGRKKKVDKSYFQFDYDYSILQKTKEILLEAVFQLEVEDKGKLLERLKNTLNYRKLTQPAGVYSCGCFFKNISKFDQEKLGLPTNSAGYIIEKAGLKKFAAGNFSVSEKHANFIICKKSGGKPVDLSALIKIIKNKVKAKFNIELKEEVQLI